MRKNHSEICRRILLPVVLFVLLLAAGLFAGTGLAETEETQPVPERTVVRLELTRSTDTPSRTYVFFLLNGEYYICSNAQISYPADPETVQALERILSEYHVDAWDGFSGSDPYVLDGEMFWFSVEYSDGTSVHAHGDNDFPENYFAASGEIEELLYREPSVPSVSPAGEYRYEGEGFGGDFTITLLPDGTYTFYEGPLSSYLGAGTWFAENARIYLSEDESPYLYNIFIPLEDALVFVAEGSDNFLYVPVPDGSRFVRTGPAETAD